MALPGVKTTILDRFYNQARTDLPGGPIIAVIAKRSTDARLDSPDLAPYPAISEQDVITQFGENSQCHRAFYELSTGGSPRAFIVPLPRDATFGAGIITSNLYGNGLNLFDMAFDVVESIGADIVVPWGRGSDTYDWDDTEGGVSAGSAATPGYPATPGGDVVVGAGTDYFAADNSTGASSWAVLVAQKCYDITFNSYPIMAVMGVKPIAGGKNLTPPELSLGLNFTSLYDKDTLATASGIGEYISIVAAEVHPISAPVSWGWSNGACSYAALMSRLPSWSATTGKPVYNVDQMRYNLTRSQATAISDKGVVCAQLDFSRVPRWVDGLTFVPATSDYTRLSTVRIIFDAVKLVKGVAQNYIGEGMSINMQNAFQTQISSVLQSMTKLGAINQSDFRVQYSPSENRAYVDLAIIPAFELREVYIQVSVNF